MCTRRPGQASHTTIIAATYTTYGIILHRATDATPQCTLSQARLARSHSAIMFSACPSVRPFVSLLPNLSTRYSQNQLASDSDVDLHNWSTGNAIKRSNLGPAVKGQAHTRRMTDLHAWPSIILDHLMSSRFYTLCLKKTRQLWQAVVLTSMDWFSAHFQK